MALVERYNVEMVHRTGAALYLDLNGDWSTDPEEAWEYDDREEAEADAERYEGEICTYQRLMRRTDAESFTGHNEAARLERAYLEAAE